MALIKKKFLTKECDMVKWGNAVIWLNWSPIRKIAILFKI